MGLSPLLVEQTFDIIEQINRQGTTIFMVEQNAAMALSIAHRAYVLQTGRVVLSGSAAELRANPVIREGLPGRDAGGVRPGQGLYPWTPPKASLGNPDLGLRQPSPCLLCAGPGAPPLAGPGQGPGLPCNCQGRPRMPHVVDLHRFPVKGLSPEPLPFLDLTRDGGLAHDRAYALALGTTAFDEAHPGPARQGPSS